MLEQCEKWNYKLDILLIASDLVSNEPTMQPATETIKRTDRFNKTEKVYHYFVCLFPSVVDRLYVHTGDHLIQSIKHFVIHFGRRKREREDEDTPGYDHRQRHTSKVHRTHENAHKRTHTVSD